MRSSAKRTVNVLKSSQFLSLSLSLQQPHPFTAQDIHMLLCLSVVLLQLDQRSSECIHLCYKLSSKLSDWRYLCGWFNSKMRTPKMYIFQHDMAIENIHISWLSSYCWVAFGLFCTAYHVTYHHIIFTSIGFQIIYEFRIDSIARANQSLRMAVPKSYQCTHFFHKQ